MTLASHADPDKGLVYVLSANGRPQHEVIERNSARCNGCGDEIESRTRHDFRSCTCGATCVDGGKDYVRRVWNGSGPGYVETSRTHYEELSNSEIAQYHKWRLW